MSKGSNRRPQKVANKQLEMNWKQIFKACGLKEVKSKVDTVILKRYNELTEQDKSWLKKSPSPNPVYAYGNGQFFAVYGVPAKHERKKKAGKK